MEARKKPALVGQVKGLSTGFSFQPVAGDVPVGNERSRDGAVRLGTGERN